MDGWPGRDGVMPVSGGAFSGGTPLTSVFLGHAGAFLVQQNQSLLHALQEQKAIMSIAESFGIELEQSFLEETAAGCIHCHAPGSCDSWAPHSAQSQGGEAFVARGLPEDSRCEILEASFSSE